MYMFVLVFCWKVAKGIPTKGIGHREKVLKVIQKPGNHPDFRKNALGDFQGIFGVFSGYFSLCPVWVCPMALDPSNFGASRAGRAGLELSDSGLHVTRSGIFKGGGTLTGGNDIRVSTGMTVR